MYVLACAHILVVFKRPGHSFLTVVTLRIDGSSTRTIFEGSSTDVCVTKDIATVRIANFSLTPIDGTATGILARTVCHIIYIVLNCRLPCTCNYFRQIIYKHVYSIDICLCCTYKR